MLLDRDADVNAQGGYYGNALQAASHQGHEKVVQILREAQGNLSGAFQVTVQPREDMMSVHHVTAGARSRQLFGQMSDASLKLLAKNHAQSRADVLKDTEQDGDNAQNRADLDELPSDIAAWS